MPIRWKLGKLEFSAARSRSFLVQLIIPLHSNFFSLSMFFGVADEPVETPGVGER